MNLKRPHIRSHHTKLLNLLTAKTPYSEVLELELCLRNQPDCVATGGAGGLPGAFLDCLLPLRRSQYGTSAR